MPTDPEQKFSSRDLNIMQGFSEFTDMGLKSLEKATAENTGSIDKLTEAIAAQTQSIGRLERDISQMVAENTAQRETMNNLIKLATALVNQRAS